MWVRFDMCNTAILAVECCSENDVVELLQRFDTVVEINKLQKLEGALVEQMHSWGKCAKIAKCAKFCKIFSLFQNGQNCAIFAKLC